MRLIYRKLVYFKKSIEIQGFKHIICIYLDNGLINLNKQWLYRKEAKNWNWYYFMFFKQQYYKNKV